jgi:hypothetical protein
MCCFLTCHTQKGKQNTQKGKQNTEVENNKLKCKLSVSSGCNVSFVNFNIA